MGSLKKKMNEDKDDILKIAHFKPKTEFLKQYIEPKHEKLPPPGNMRLGLIGPSGCGKSSLLVSLLFKQYSSIYHKVYVCSPTYHTDDLYSVLYEKIPDSQVCTELDKVDEFFNDILHEQENEKRRMCLIAFDDFGSETKKIKCLNTIARLRHYNCSIIISVQKMSWLSTTIRNNLNYVCLFEPNSMYERKMICHEYCWKLTPNEFYQLFQEATKKHGSFLFIRLHNYNPAEHYSIRFDTPVSVC